MSSAAAIFQRCIENLLEGGKGVPIYMDDIFVMGKSTEEHLHNLENILSKLESAGLRLNKSKCYLLCPEVEYLGHIIDADGYTQPKKR